MNSHRIKRREWLWKSGGGLGGIALSHMLATHGLLAGDVSGSGGGYKLRTDGGLHHRPKAKRVIQLFMAGGASHVDLFDYKSELVKRSGQPANFGERVEAFQDGLGPWLGPAWPFKAYGQTGKMLADVVAPLGHVVDEIAFIHNMVGKTGVHSQAALLQTTGFERPGFPGVGAWVSYGLGSLNENLPTFVVLPDHRGLPSNGSKLWDNGFLKAQHRGATIYPGSPKPIEDLDPPPQADYVSAESERAGLELLGRLNRNHALDRPGDDRLEARIKSYELAASMQLAAPEALDFSREPQHVLRLYGLDAVKSTYPSEINAPEETVHFSRRCLAARRLVERGVRFVQVWSGNDNGFPRRNWDSHEDIKRDHGPLAAGMARGAAALIEDLRQRGLLDDTIVLWTSEFGRLPSSQGGKGRDHNPFCFTNWLCGGGVKAGTTHGPSDDFGYKPADRKSGTEVYDLHATILHLLGIDHEKLTVRHNGIDRRLTDVHGKLIPQIIS